MKKFVLILIAVSLILANPKVLFAQTASPSAKPTEKATTGLLSQINNLKDKIASKVAQLKLVEKRGIIGVVTETTTTQITLTDIQDQTRFVDVDEITKFSSGNEKDFGISDLKKGTKVSILGLYNKESRRILARFVDVVSLPEYFSGTITKIDRPNYTITVETGDKKTMTVDIESSTKSNSYSIEDLEPTRTGFTKMTVGEKVFIVGTPDEKEKNRVSGDRILLFPDFSGSAEPLETDTTPSPTTKAGAKTTLTPTTAAKKVTATP